MRTLDWQRHIGGYQGRDAPMGKGDYSFGDFTDNEIKQMERDRERYYKDKEQSKKASENAQKISDLQKQLASQKKAPAPQAKPKAKPKGDQQIEPVKHSPEISAARKVANDYMANQQKTPWQEAQSNANSSGIFGEFNPGGNDDSPQTGSDQVNQMKQSGQDFADKYKLDLIKSGATNNGFS